MSDRQTDATSIEIDYEQLLERVDYDFGLSRRQFVQALGAGILIAVAARNVEAQERRGGGNRGGGRGGGRSVPIDARLHIGKDGAITVLTGKVECGQGARAEITQAAAEELGVAPDRVQLVMGDTDLCPDDGITAGSRTTPSTIPSVRQACAAAKAILAKLTGDANSRDYAKLAASDELKGLPSDVTVTKIEDWKVLGTPVHRPNARDIVTGAHQYPADVIRPGMLYGKVLRPISYGATLKSIDLESAKAVNGVTVVRDGNFVGVAAPTTDQAKKAIAALEQSAKWDSPPQPSSSSLFDYLRQNAKGGIPKNPFEDQFKSAAKSLNASYNVAYIQHAPMEPRAAVAEWNGDRLTVWTGTQNPFGNRRELAGAFHIEESKVRVIAPDFGGGFGGKHTAECAIEAARLAKSAGKPVALRWTREEEFTWAYFRPAAALEVRAALDASGKITSWHFVNINSGRSSIESPYRIENNRSDYVDSAPPLRHGSYRALAATANSFAREVAMDELAILAGKNPLEFRLAHLDSKNRLHAALSEAAKQFGWADRITTRSNPNVGMGLACSTDKGSFVATCAEIAIDEKNAIHVRRVVQAFDCGAITNPENLKSQNQGGIMQGIGPALREAMRFENGKIQNASFWKYQPPRFEDMPEIEVHLIDRKDQPSAGAGETPLICIAPAIANAVFNATGK
ncbi:MAG TPA: molybdopterin cofactor-binding domain-containing protein, partial [Tepidisphaeraceae bacterium]|nr:molybdopterin cofactor-binding domain-containing protein [Tepidisphaeraceae bacterium]